MAKKKVSKAKKAAAVVKAKKRGKKPGPGMPKGVKFKQGAGLAKLAGKKREVTFTPERPTKK